MSWLFLLLTGLCSTARADLRQTHWILDEGSGWTDSEREALDALAGRLPEAYRQPRRPVRFHKAEATTSDPSDPHRHVQVHPRRGSITLRIDGLTGPGSRVEIQRAAVHGLTHLIDHRQRLSRQAAWRSISGWSRRSGPLAIRPAGESEFAAPAGMRSPAEDLATFAEAYFLPGDFGPMEADQHPWCRHPNKVRFLEEATGARLTESDVVQCSALVQLGLTSADVASVQILWASPTLANPGSTAGHLMVMLEIDTPRGRTEEVWSMVALTPDEIGLLAYSARGVFGGFLSRVVRQSYAETARVYQYQENRDLLHYTLRLTEAEEQALLERLSELNQSWDRPYYFFQRNCTELIFELLEASGHPLKATGISPPDKILSELTRDDRITARPENTTVNLAPASRARQLAETRAAAAGSLCGQDSTARRGEDTEEHYARILAMAQQQDSATCWQDVARFVALSTPLQEASQVRAAQHEQELHQEAWSALLQAARQHTAIEQRQGYRAEARAVISEKTRAELPQTRASLQTPYRQWTTGVLLQDTASEPMLYARLQMFNVINGEPARYPLVWGASAALLDGMVALDPRQPADILLDATLLDAQTIVSPPEQRAAMSLGMSLAEVRLDTSGQRGDVRWATLRAGSHILHSPDWRHQLGLLVGVGVESALGAGADDGPSSHLIAPLGIRGSAHGDGPLAGQLLLDAAWVPSSGAAEAYGEAEATARIWLTPLRHAGLFLELHGALQVPGADPAGGEQQVGVGLRIKPN